MFVLFTFRSESLSLAVMLDPPLPTREELPCEVLFTSKVNSVSVIGMFISGSSCAVSFGSGSEWRDPRRLEAVFTPLFSAATSTAHRTTQG